MTEPRPTGRWFRDIYRDAVWESEELTAQEKAIAETYARHARNAHNEKTPDADLAWLTYPRLMTKAGIGRRANVSSTVAGLVDRGWLTVVREVPRRPTVYRLTIPALGSTGGTSDRSSTVGTTASSGGGTTVVPKIASGSSASRSGSSDGGTQPLRPLEDQPLPTSPLPATAADAPPGADTQGEGNGSPKTETRNPHHEQATHLAAPYTNQMRAGQLADLKTQLAAALNRGWTTDALEHELADRHDGLHNLGDGLISRIRKLAQQPAPPEPPQPAPRDNAPCPHPDHRRQRARSCSCCRSAMNGGQDPFAGHEHLRPDWWADVYGTPPPPKPANPIDDAVNAYLTAYQNAATTTIRRSLMASITQRISQQIRQLHDQNMPDGQLIHLATEAGARQANPLDLVNPPSGDDTVQRDVDAFRHELNVLNTRPAIPECGRRDCRDGWYKLGINVRRCHLCPDPNEQDTVCAS